MNLQEKIAIVRTTNGYENLSTMLGEDSAKLLYEILEEVSQDTSKKQDVHSLTAYVENDELRNIEFNGVNNSNIMNIVSGLLDFVIQSEREAGNDEDSLSEMLDELAINVRMNNMLA